MWNAGNNYTKEELEVVKELERELFKHDPGFRAMWHDDFEAYFQGTLDKELWDKRERERRIELQEIERKNMLTDFRYVRFRHQMADFEKRIFSESFYSDDEEFEAYYKARKQREDSDKTYQAAKAWSRELADLAFQLYEKNKLVDLFRIWKNANLIAPKFAHAFSAIDESNESIEWSTYGLVLALINRSLESLERLEKEDIVKVDFGSFRNTGKQIKLELMDRLENLSQRAIRTKI